MLFKLLFLSFVGFSFGNWVQDVSVGSSKEWQAIAMSGNGTIQTAVESHGNIWTSNNTGVDWIEDNSVGNILYWSDIAMGEDGTIQTAVTPAYGLWRSNDTGVNWIEDNSVGNILWYGIAMNHDGTIQTAVGVGNIWIYNNSGVDWINVTPPGTTPHTFWFRIAMSSDGTIQTAVTLHGNIWRSNDAGVTWIEDNSVGIKNWRDIAMNHDGTIQTAVVYGGNIFTSNDTGANWTEVAITNNWNGIVMNHDGTIQTAVVYGGNIFTSNDSGTNWTEDTSVESLENLASISMNHDGTIRTAITSAITYGGYIWRFADESSTSPTTTPLLNSSANIYSVDGYYPLFYNSNLSMLVDLTNKLSNNGTSHFHELSGNTTGVQNKINYSMPDGIKFSHGDIPDIYNQGGELYELDLNNDTINDTLTIQRGNYVLITYDTNESIYLCTTTICLVDQNYSYISNRNPTLFIFNEIGTFYLFTQNQQQFSFVVEENPLDQEYVSNTGLPLNNTIIFDLQVNAGLLMYKGCYADTDPFDYTFEHVQINPKKYNNTFEECLVYCSEYLYMGRQSFGMCLCSNDFDNITKFGPSENCLNASNYEFFGHSANAIYEILTSPPTTSSPTSFPTYSNPTSSPTVYCGGTQNLEIKNNTAPVSANVFTQVNITLDEEFWLYVKNNHSYTKFNDGDTNCHVQNSLCGDHQTCVPIPDFHSNFGHTGHCIDNNINVTIGFRDYDLTNIETESGDPKIGEPTNYKHDFIKIVPTRLLAICGGGDRDYLHVYVEGNHTEMYRVTDKGGLLVSINGFEETNIISPSLVKFNTNNLQTRKKRPYKISASSFEENINATRILIPEANFTNTYFICSSVNELYPFQPNSNNVSTENISDSVIVEIVEPQLLGMMVDATNMSKPFLKLYFDAGIYQYYFPLYISLTGIQGPLFNYTGEDINLENYDTDRGFNQGLTYLISRGQDFNDNTITKIEIQLNEYHERFKTFGNLTNFDTDTVETFDKDFRTIPQFYDTKISLLPLEIPDSEYQESRLVSIHEPFFQINFTKPGLYTIKSSANRITKVISVLEGCTFAPTISPTASPSKFPSISPTDSPVASTFPPTYTLIVESSGTAISTNLIAMMAIMAIFMVMMVAVMCYCYRKSSKKLDKRGNYRKIKP